MCARNLNPGTHIWAADVLLIEPSPRVLKLFITGINLNEYLMKHTIVYHTTCFYHPPDDKDIILCR